MRRLWEHIRGVGGNLVAAALTGLSAQSQASLDRYLLLPGEGQRACPHPRSPLFPVELLLDPSLWVPEVDSPEGSCGAHCTVGVFTAGRVSAPFM